MKFPEYPFIVYIVALICSTRLAPELFHLFKGAPFGFRHENSNENCPQHAHHTINPISNL
jgi:hypothetical protein